MKSSHSYLNIDYNANGSWVKLKRKNATRFFCFGKLSKIKMCLQIYENYYFEQGSDQFITYKIHLQINKKLVIGAMLISIHNIKYICKYKKICNWSNAQIK
jgi:hypothetical protein